MKNSYFFIIKLFIHIFQLFTKEIYDYGFFYKIFFNKKEAYKKFSLTKEEIHEKHKIILYSTKYHSTKVIYLLTYKDLNLKRFEMKKKIQIGQTILICQNIYKQFSSKKIHKKKNFSSKNIKKANINKSLV